MKKRVNKKLERKIYISKQERKKQRGILGLYKESWRYLVESRKFILFSVVIFLIFSLIGFFVPAPTEVEKLLYDFLEELAKETEGMNSLQLMAYIFWNNLKSSFFGMILGVGVGIFPFITASLNGYVVGFVSSVVARESSIFELWRLLPHGIFELPAIFISLGLGLGIGYGYYKNIRDFLKKRNLLYVLNICFGLILLILLAGLMVFGFIGDEENLMTILLIALSILFCYGFILFFIILIDYLIYYFEKGSYFFLIISIILFPILLFNLIFNRKLETRWNRDIVYSLRIFLLIIIPLLIIAAIIEGLLIALTG